jgi:fibrillarin-like rRNA methylase
MTMDEPGRYEAGPWWDFSAEEMAERNREDARRREVYAARAETAKTTAERLRKWRERRALLAALAYLMSYTIGIGVYSYVLYLVMAALHKYVYGH